MTNHNEITMFDQDTRYELLKYKNILRQLGSKYLHSTDKEGLDILDIWCLTEEIPLNFL